MRPQPQRLPAFLGGRAAFPDPNLADAEGLVAFGGEMTVGRLLLAYRNGIFPWTAQPVTWWSPDPRAIIELDQFHVPRSLLRNLSKGRFSFTVNKAFGEVMLGCAAPAKGRRSTWISTEFIEAYTLMHRQGHAHSVECWEKGELVGGIYGVATGGLFAGESMFHRASDASKAALHHLVGRLKERGFKLFDIQMLTPVTAALGGKNIPRREYLERLREAVKLPVGF